MVQIVGVRFRNTGKSYYFDPKDLELRVDDRVIVETARGIEMGTVTLPPMEMEEAKVKMPLREIIRVANDRDMEQEESNREKEKDAYRICREKIREHGLAMKLVQAEYTFDRNKLLFYFTADGRVDFRGLVRDLAGIFRTRIELRQIGVRDETRILGGIGVCGRELCCKQFLTSFSPVSIKMAKEQNLSLNPSKISGTCGRLMCCLSNEEETYEYLNSMMPKKNEWVETPTGERGTVVSRDILRQKVGVFFETEDGREVRSYDAADLTFRSRKRPGEIRDTSEKKTDPEEYFFSGAIEKDENAKQQDNQRESDRQSGGQSDKEFRRNGGYSHQNSRDSRVRKGEGKNDGKSGAGKGAGNKHSESRRGENKNGTGGDRPNQNHRNRRRGRKNRGSKPSGGGSGQK